MDILFLLLITCGSSASMFNINMITTLTIKNAVMIVACCAMGIIASRFQVQVLY